MNYQLQPTQLSTADVGMGFGWQPNAYNKYIGNSQFTLDALSAGIQCMSSGVNDRIEWDNLRCDSLISADTVYSYAEEISFKPLEQISPNYSTLVDTMDPTSLWPASMDKPGTPHQQAQMQAPVQSSSTLRTHRNSSGSGPMTIAQRRNMAGAPRSSSTSSSTPSSVIVYARSTPIQASTPTSMDSVSAISAAPVESEKTRRARYAANQRHSKTQQAREDCQQSESSGVANTGAAERKQCHRKKNNVAAAKCRSRRRKQVQTIQEKEAQLGEKNVQLKTMFQELRGELNGLRSMALDHQQCNCLVAQYNHSQAKRVVREYSSSCLGHECEGLRHLPEQRGFQVQWLPAVAQRYLGNAMHDFAEHEVHDFLNESFWKS
jgi:hypothetical protein